MTSAKFRRQTPPSVSAAPERPAFDPSRRLAAGSGTMPRDWTVNVEANLYVRRHGLPVSVAPKIAADWLRDNPDPADPPPF